MSHSLTPDPPGSEAKSARKTALGWSALLLSAALGWTYVYWHTFIDEGDNIAVGALIADGQVLYRDLFSHHFPLPYYWIALMARLFEPSIAVFRGSVLMLQTASFAAAMWLTPYPLALGLAALAWRAVAPPYYGNMVVYSGFAGSALIPVLSISLAVACRTLRPGRTHAIAVGLFSAIALLSDPLAVYPVAAALFVLALRSPRRAALALVVAVLAVLPWPIHLAATGAFGAFVADVFHFNSNVYAKYTPVEPFPLWAALRAMLSGLDLTDPRWREVGFLLDAYRQPDRLWATGFFYRLAVLAMTFALLWRRRFLAAGLLYLFVSIEMGVLGAERFRAIPFVLAALLCAAWFVSGEGWSRETESAASGRVRSLPGGVARMIAAVCLFWLVVDGSKAIVSNRSRLSYEANFGRYERDALAVTRLACGRRDVSLGWYPSDPLMHFFSGLPPVAGYPFVLPWVAEVAMGDLLRELREHDTIVFVDREGQIWGYENDVFLGPVIRLLETHYHEVGPNLFVSPGLFSTCRERVP